MTSENELEVDSGIPRPGTPFWRWPWSSYGRWQKIWIAARHVAAKPLLTLAALIAAVLLVVQIFPDAWHKIAWRQAQYDMLGGIHAGYSLQYITDQLGEPAITSVAVESPRLVQHVYLGRDYFVGVVTNTANQAILVSFVSCDKHFAPYFEGPLGSQIQLQSVPLAQAETVNFGERVPQSRQEQADAQANSRFLTFVPGSNGSSLDQLIETGIASGSGATRNRGYYIGVNGACGRTLPEKISYDEMLYTGNIEDASVGLLSARQKTAANFYTETYDLAAGLDAEGRLYMKNEQGAVQPDTLFDVSPWFFDLPAQIVTLEGTQSFDG